MKTKLKRRPGVGQSSLIII